VERKADDVRVRPLDPSDVARSETLNRVGARLAPPFTGRDVSRDLRFAQNLEGDARFGQALAERALAAAHGNCRHHAVAAAGQKLETLPRFTLGFRFWQNAAAAGDDRVRRKHNFFHARTKGGLRFRSGKTLRERPWKLSR